MQQLILIPSLITLAVTLLRLAGEKLGWSKAFFNPAAGGGGAIVGIAWLVPVFGIYFALKLAKSGEGPENAWKALGMAVVALLIGVAAGMATSALKFGLRRSLATFVVVSFVAVAVAWRGWPALGRTLVAYGLLARIPVALVMLAAIFGQWGTHYDVAPPNAPYIDQMAPIMKWFWIGLVPQLTIWIMFTVVLGVIFGALAVGVVKPRPA